ncbi:MAG TPA: bifunctional DNA-formamidopyrimidine glycosylase/DNA-(apurinic or apyrimidinic site) lyase [Burkholderiaceae bacterium]|nr:bifunctional DNA-formamidopyrimidine glycosylase/DNA-(apurinic or apyrimidinic site) lyase [Burkholderiaceae bacterium]
MPELPEVEVTRRALQPAVDRHTVVEVEVRERRLRWPVATDLESTLRGRRVERLERRGKYLLWKFEHGTMISHLGMSGAWRVWPREAAPPPRTHDHVDIVFDDHVVRLTDPRRFGALLWHPAEAGPVALHPLLARLGMEPFDARFSGDVLYAGTRGRAASIKQVLLAGQVVVGVGNIYASEALFRAGIRPMTAATRLSRARCERLAQAVRAVLTEAIGVGGSTLRDFYSAAGEEGYFMLDAAVYERAGQPCRICGARVRRIVQGQRATYYCPHCQRR